MVDGTRKATEAKKKKLPNSTETVQSFAAGVPLACRRLVPRWMGVHLRPHSSN